MTIGTGPLLNPGQLACLVEDCYYKRAKSSNFNEFLYQAASMAYDYKSESFMLVGKYLRERARHVANATDLTDYERGLVIYVGLGLLRRGVYASSRNMR